MNPVYPHDDEIDGEVLDVVIGEVHSSGYAEVGTEYTHQLIAWVPLEVLGVLRTDAVRENRRGRTSAWVQEDGNAKIGPREKWAGRRIAIFVLEDTKDQVDE